ncbi:hypothetical protein BSL78_05909 [Apostichopus japonicus]|uniref:Uncharacterized protein n=2 Tax=Stichopus japonicus TaxID=307972 RepID=A0A2G8LA66_STIJA|nr:hypothetical protein BSL78_05909 [Apostichopus japonicus]
MVQLIGRFGSILSPFLLYLDERYPSLAFSFMAFVAGLTAFLTFLLPETLGTVQPTTREDLQELFRNRRIITFRNGCRLPRGTTKSRSNTSEVIAPSSISRDIATANENIDPEKLNNSDVSKQSAKLGTENYAFETTQL